jgi:hypothetical protein
MNDVSFPRVRSVRLKSGGAKLYIYRNNRAQEFASSYRRQAAGVYDRRKNDMGGYAIVAWSFDGNTSCVIGGDGTHVSRHKVADFVKTVIQDYFYGGDM